MLDPEVVLEKRRASRARLGVTVDLTFPRLFPDDELREARLRLRARWRAEGLYEDLTIADCAARAAHIFATSELRCFDADQRRVLTMAELWDDARRVGAGLAELGVRPGDPVAVQLPNLPETAIAYVAASVVGAVLVLIPQTYGPAESALVMREVEPRVVIAGGARPSGDAAACLVPHLGPSTALVAVGTTAAERALDWDDLVHAEPMEPVASGADDPYLVLFTSGTTGRSKAVVHSHNSWIAELRTMPSPPSGLGPGTVTVQPMPSGHVGGLASILGPLVHGCHTIVFDGWDTGVVVDAIISEGAVAISGVPTMHLRILGEVEARGLPIPLRYGVTGGAGIPRVLVERADRLGWRIDRCYGCSEHPSATMTLPDDDLATRLATDGAASQGTEIAIVDEHDQAVAVGAEGEVALIGPEQFVGYSDPALNARAFTTAGWFKTGDIGRLHEDGRLTITDRKSDIIIRGGVNISSVEVEDVLMLNPAIVEAAVVAAPDDHYGERVHAFVRVVPGATIDLNAIRRQFAAAGVARHKTPERLDIVTDFERTPAGKVQKGPLRARSAATRKGSI